jgi:hypothetical protein
MSDQTNTVDPRLEGFLASAAHIGEETSRAIADLKTRTNKAVDAQNTARKVSDEIAQESSGFKTPLFVGLVSVANAFSQVFNDTTSQSAIDAANAASRSFMASATGSTEASLKGGRVNGYADAIRLGNDATRVIDALQGRLNHWNRVLEGAKAIEDAAKRAIIVTQAKRYTLVCTSTPETDGSWPKSKNGEVTKPKFNGRPANHVNGVNIPAARGLPRDGQLAAFIALFKTYGDETLHPDVVDAFLDNGGRYVDPNADSPTALASQALEKVNALLLAGANASGDAASLSVLVSILDRIAREGLRDSKVAQSPAPTQMDDTPTQSDETTEDAEATDATDSEVTQESDEGVAFGAPPPRTNTDGTTQTTRSRRRARGK